MNPAAPFPSRPSRALDAGCTEYVSKTVGITLIPEVVDRYLQPAQP